jgi:putative thiamine transport system substrate-binding protein
MILTRRRFSALLAAVPLLPTGALAAGLDFAAVRERARGQTVYFNAWGGSGPINDYIAWAGAETKARFGVEIVQVKLTDTSEAVGRVVAEKAAGRTAGGSVDLVWINGENFKAMQEQALLQGPFATDLPNFALVDTAGKPTTLVDFTVPTNGYESPWGQAQFVFIHDSATTPEPPLSIAAFADWIEAHPGRFTWPAPPDFVGTTFLKHVLYETTPEPARLQQAAADSDWAASTAGIWAWFDRVQPKLWRSGRAYPATGPALHQLMEDGEVDFSMAFNPAEASGLVLAGRLPPTTRTFLLSAGTIGNTHFVAIPFNAAHAEGAMVVADFLLSPEAQAKKQDPDGWGDFTVLAMGKLTPEDRLRFTSLPRGPATLPPEALKPVRLEPHPSWMTRIEQDWLRRYGQ